VLAVLTIVCVSAFADASNSKNDSIIDIENMFVPSGWMGDGEYGQKYLTFSGEDRSNPHSSPVSTKVIYRFGPKRWAGIYWQNKANNWGDKKGTDYSKKGITHLSFWARGETGNEMVEFKSGDINDPNKKFHDSFSETTGRILLTKEWKEYKIDLTGADLSSVIGGFCWVASADFNSGTSATFYIDDIAFK